MHQPWDTRARDPQQIWKQTQTWEASGHRHAQPGKLPVLFPPWHLCTRATQAQLPEEWLSPGWCSLPSPLWSRSTVVRRAAGQNQDPMRLPSSVPLGIFKNHVPAQGKANHLLGRCQLGRLCCLPTAIPHPLLKSIYRDEQQEKRNTARSCCAP